MNVKSLPYPTPSHRPSYPIRFLNGETGLYQPSQYQMSDLSKIEQEDLLRCSSLDNYKDAIIDLPKTRRIIDPSRVEEYSKSNYIRGIIKLENRIIPNSLLYSKHNPLFLQVDPRKKNRFEDLANKEQSSTIPSEYRYKEMKLNNYGFYDIDFEQFNKYFFFLLPDFHLNV